MKAQVYQLVRPRLARRLHRNLLTANRSAAMCCEVLPRQQLQHVHKWTEQMQNNPRKQVQSVSRHCSE